jgi:alanine dehydrogenase
MTSNVARTASRAMADAVLPYVLEIAEHGLEAALARDAGLARGVYLYGGRVVHEAVARLLGAPATPLADLLGKAGER